MIKITAEEFKVFSQYIHTICGISLDSSKTYLIENRLADLMRETGCNTFSEFYYKAKADYTNALPRKVIDAITTGETLFFRDASPFDLLKFKILPEVVDRRTKSTRPGALIPLRIWSAACSTGQEVYSIAITLREMLGDLARYNIRLIGTDISNQAIANASRGIYNRIEIERGLPPDKMERYFTRQDSAWKIRDEVRGMATFRGLNLMEDFSSLGKFDIIFCRNVAIYFSETDKVSLFGRIARALEPDGALIIGSTESITGLCPQFEPKRYLRSVYYQLK